jgi:prephenate dehydrogenase
MALNITVVGLDQLGGALGLALGTLSEDALTSGRPTITGWDPNQRSVREARDRLMIDQPAASLADAVRGADVVFVNGTPAEIGSRLAEIGPLLKAGAIVSDLASTKADVLAAAQRALPTTVSFVGGNPMLPRISGLRDAKADLLRGTIYCLVPGPTARPEAIETVAALVEAIGAKPYYIDAAEHDGYVAAVQHLPVVVAAALMESVSSSGSWRELQPIAGEAFGTATAAANADPAASAALCQSNSAAIAGRIDDLIRILSEIRAQLDQPEQLEALFGHARTAHEQWQAARPNMRPGETAYLGMHDDPIPTRGLGSFLFGQRKRGDRGPK